MVLKSRWLIIVFILFIFSSIFLVRRTFQNVSLNYEGFNKPIEKQNSLLHQSSNFKLDIESFSQSSGKNSQKIYGIIVPHHLLASSLISETFSQIQNPSKISQVVILSPNHFLNGKGSIITSDIGWQTQDSSLESDKELIRQLLSLNFASSEYAPIENEHGIFYLLPFIKKFLPESKIIPLMIKDSLSEEEVKKLARFFQKELSENALIIVSTDFSHYLSKEVADFHDKASQAALYNLDPDFLSRIDNDSPSSLAILFHYLKLMGAEKFVLVKNTNSVNLSGDLETEETTSYIAGYFLKGEKTKLEQVSILVLGDLMIDRYVYSLTKKANDFNYPFQKIQLFLKGVNFKIANLEGPITNFDSLAVKDNGLRFTFSPQFLKSLKEHFDVFNLANNHTLDFGEEGLRQTKDFLEKEDLKFFGSLVNKKDDFSIIIEKNGLKIGFLGYNSLSAKNLNEIIAEIRSLKILSDFVIVFAHWGDEYKENLSRSQQEEAMMLIEAGTDLIVGSHPHVIEPLEIYKNKVIFYSLGNFIFDQYFSDEVKEGLTIGINLRKEYNSIKSSYYIFPISINDTSQPELMEREESEEILEKLAQHSKVKENIKEEIKRGYLSYVK